MRNLARSTAALGALLVLGACGAPSTPAARTTSSTPPAVSARLVAAPVSSCVERDVLGGGWADPGERWADLRTRVEQWSPSNNTFPALASHPQRVVGWASLTLQSTTLDAAHEFAGHAQLHVAETRKAFEDCRR